MREKMGMTETRTNYRSSTAGCTPISKMDFTNPTNSTPRDSTPPKSIWPLIDRIDMGHTALVYAAGCIVKFLEGERRGKELEEFGSTIEQLSDMIDRMAGRVVIRLKRLMSSLMG